MGKSQLIIKKMAYLAMEMAKRIFHDFDPNWKWRSLYKTEPKWKRGYSSWWKVRSNPYETERLMLNVMQRIASGIATTTRKYAKALEGTKTRSRYSQDNSRYAYDREKRPYVSVAAWTIASVCSIWSYWKIIMWISPAASSKRSHVRKTIWKRKESLKIEIEVRNFDELEQAWK